MPDTVTIVFDGLMLFRLKDQLCQIKLHTAAKGHVLKLKVTANQRTLVREVFCGDMLKMLHPVNLFVDTGTGRPNAPTVADAGTFNKILNLAGSDFYQRIRTIKPAMYECAINLFEGSIGANALLDDCMRVEEKLFPHLKYHWDSDKDWGLFKQAIQSISSEYIKELPLFARSVKAELALSAGQSLRMVSEKTGKDLFEPLTTGRSYDVSIEYADVDLPESLADCLGFAHHSEALELGAGEPVYGIFKPVIGGSINTVTKVGCCDCVRMDD